MGVTWGTRLDVYDHDKAVSSRSFVGKSCLLIFKKRQQAIRHNYGTVGRQHANITLLLTVHTS